MIDKWFQYFVVAQSKSGMFAVWNVNNIDDISLDEVQKIEWAIERWVRMVRFAIYWRDKK